MYPTPVKRGIRHHVSHTLDKFASKREIRTLPPNLADYTPAFDIPSLPTELWLVILREATFIVPDPLHNPANHAFLSESHSSSAAPCRRADYEAAMHAKVQLACVSSVWNRMMQPIIFEFVWIRSAKHGKALALLLLEQAFKGTIGPTGGYIRRLHIETRLLDRCAVEDARSIIDHAPNLLVYTDQHSVRRERMQECPDAKYIPENVFAALSHKKSLLQRLVWTNYDQDDIFPFYISPTLHHMADTLEYLELSSANFDVSPNQATSSLRPTCVSLPRLRSLKVVLDNVTFAMMATWDLPRLKNLYVMSQDFMYAGEGFANFFATHGPQITELELGHSSAIVEEHLVLNGAREPIPLAKWLPNLVHFICSANADWNWRTPDYISPHVLLPTHPTVELIGIRDLDARLAEDGRGSSEYFRLRQQIASLFRETAFPKLQYIRDLSKKSDQMRSEGGLSGSGPSEKIIEFWSHVLGMGRDGGVWFEGFDGTTITHTTLGTAARGSLDL
ncbi:hypothetical protein FIBSPDRAFT_902289 [Athelia psychrophila]|uniref:F-box domain-containing protein n=1 Tax=Athelia psychrophila TaxID=1759441 RepID=A0A167XDH3_9AGAM|nr:hypothetical protein FIBSPDRAFT_902289 [Fibularhizoctonia sp. CBS 109695]